MAETRDKMTEKGVELAELLHLKKNSKGRYDTSWGDKSPLGLYLTVNRFIEESQAEIKELQETS